MIVNWMKIFSLFSLSISESLRGGTTLNIDYYTSILALLGILMYVSL